MIEYHSGHPSCGFNRIVFSFFFFLGCLPEPGISAHDKRYHTLAMSSIQSFPIHLSSNGDLDLDTGVDVDNDLLDDLGRGVEATH